eukprot:CAMPEP_0201479966 /NCGR_PEP_ID=MMETSP0151_2-20130828/4571_1 /ASSEMBLY_ACC=CAM_ASM_000257 /TAXON_ID=200890 /ORGANISM="Paramoeba atlantica, Strain 621/1 / CCAP 1560/9" /LENGTH=666 /DNA_ID=CAMNT_0047861695 /DNA_START=170 /DNA_END=2170 /DNA_ORIENTATION=-
MGDMKQFSVVRMDGREAQRQCTDADESLLLNNFAQIFAKQVITPDEEGSPTEVEIRIGKISETAFVPGATESDYRSLENSLKGPNFSNDFEPRVEETVDLFYELDGDETSTRVRLTCEPATELSEFDLDESKIKQCIQALSKNSFSKEDFKGIAGRWNPLYDLRLSVMEEVIYDPPTSEQIPWGSISEWRTKKRIYFTPTDKNRHWNIQLTETVNMLKEQKFEIEFELLRESTKEIEQLDEDEEKKVAYCQNVAADLIQMLNILFDRHQAIQAFVPLIQGVRTSKVSDEGLLGELRLDCLQSIPHWANSQQRKDPKQYGFPGTMPVSFSRRHFQPVQTREYVVSEKADGIRYFLFVSQKGVYLIDRKFDFFEIQGFNSLRELFPEGKTIVDGEIVTDLVTDNPKYVVFDLIELNGENHAQQDTFKRHEKIGEFIGILRRNVTGQWPFEILGKFFFPKEKIHELLRVIGPDRNYRKDERRQYACDGLLFTPRLGPYKTKGHDGLLKWKFLDRQSIDFQVDFGYGGKSLQLFCEGGSDQAKTMCRRIFLDGDRYSELANILRRRNTHNIAEFTYCSTEGEWKFQMMRTDKDKANHTSVAFDTLEAIAQNITHQELSYRIPRPPSRDDWAQRQRAFLDSMAHSGGGGGQQHGSHAGHHPGHHSGQKPRP